VRQVLRELIAETIPTVALRNASEQPSPPSDLKYCNLRNQEELGLDERNYPVLVWGVYTYWGEFWDSCYTSYYHIDVSDLDASIYFI
jgi:hypothetical protein